MSAFTSKKFESFDKNSADKIQSKKGPWPCRVGLNEEFGMQTEIICQIQSVKGAPSGQETLNGIDAKNFCTLPGGPHTRGYLIFYIFV